MWPHMQIRLLYIKVCPAVRISLACMLPGKSSMSIILGMGRYHRTQLTSGRSLRSANRTSGSLGVTPGCRWKISSASTRNASPKPSSAALSSMPRLTQTRPEHSPATTTFREQFPPRGHEPPAWLYPVPYGCAAL